MDALFTQSLPFSHHAAALFAFAFGFFQAFRVLRRAAGWGGVTAIAMAASVWVLSTESFATTPISAPRFGVFYLVLSEAVRGFMVAAPAAILFESIPFLGRVIDSIRGAQNAESLAPIGGERHSLLESAFLYGSVVALTESGLHLKLFQTFSQAWNRSLADHASQFSLIEWGTKTFELSLLVGAPVLITITFFELIVSVMAKFFGRALLLQEILTLKPVAALVVVGLSLQFYPFLFALLQNLYLSAWA